MIKLGMQAVIWWHYRRVKRFLAQADQAPRIQREALFSKIRRNADSDFGRAHRFGDIRNVDDFRRQVPITDYDYYYDYIERVKQGQVTAMFAPSTKILMFAMSSGTTNKSKFIPITGDFFREYRDSWLVWGARNFHDHSELLGKKNLQLTSDWQQFHTEGGIPCGNISGLAIEVAPRITRPIHALPPMVNKIHDTAAKQYTVLRIAMRLRNVGMAITANPSTLVELARRADQHRESLIRDIYDGTLSQELNLPAKVRESLRPYITRADKTRAKELEGVVERTGSLFPKDFWPEMSMLCVWLGGSVGVYLPMLKEYYGDTALRDHGLSATEGHITTPIEDGTCAGILDYRNMYYEFVPRDELESDSPTILEAHELEEGKDYFILLTTSNGLYRYDIHDVVRCVGYEGRTPVLEFLNKGAHFSSITGEKLSEFQVVSSVKQAYEDLGLPIEQFTIAPVMEGGRPGYVLLLEPIQPHQQPRDNARITSAIEGHLKKLNIEYGEKQDSGRLLPLAVQEVPPGTWDALRARKRAENRVVVEYKHPCLVGDLEFVNRIADVASAAK